MQKQDEISELQLETLKASLSNVSEQKNHKNKKPYKFKQKIQQKEKQLTSNNQIDVLQAGEYLKLLSHQKKYISQRRAQKIFQINESASIQQEDYRYLFLVTTQAHYQKLQYPHYYQKLVQSIPNYPKNMFSGIQKDIPRTLMPNHPFHEALRNILTAYAIRNPNLLYCQGMNYVVAYFLINNIPEEQSFWVLVSLIQNILPDDFYKDLSTISIGTQIFTDVLPYYFPQLATQMKTVGMDSSLFVVSWYVCLFTKGFINSVAAYLFIRLILDSRKQSFGFNLLKLSLGIIATILGRQEPFSFRPQFSSFRDRLQLSVFQISLIEIKLGVNYIELNQQNYCKLQNYYRSKKEKKHISSLQKDLANKKLTLPRCQPEFPICLQRIQIKRKIGELDQVQIFKNGYNIKSQYIEDYFNNATNNKSQYPLYEVINDCMILRQNHICQEMENLPNNLQKLEKKLFNLISLRDQQSFIFSQKKIKYQQNDSIEKNRYSKMDQKLIQLSGLFIVDHQFNFCQQDQNQEQQLNQNRLGKYIKNSQEENQTFNLQEELQKNNIQQDWETKQNEFKSYKNHLQQKEKLKNTNYEYNNNDQEKIDLNDTNLTLKNNLWGILGKTWKKVLRIKEYQLK